MGSVGVRMALLAVALVLACSIPSAAAGGSAAATAGACPLLVVTADAPAALRPAGPPLPGLVGPNVVWPAEECVELACHALPWPC